MLPPLGLAAPISPSTLSQGTISIEISIAAPSRGEYRPRVEEKYRETCVFNRTMPCNGRLEACAGMEVESIECRD